MKPVEFIPYDLRKDFTQDNKILVNYSYYNDIDTSKKFENSYTKENIDQYIQDAKDRKPKYYEDIDFHLFKALDDFPIDGKDVIIFGSLKPWYESIALARNAKSVTVLEYNPPKLIHDKISYHDVRNGLPKKKFDIAFSISVFEHTGLGRYGDPIDPEGDLKAMKEASSSLKKNGLLFLSVPIGEDLLVWNAHRIYGPKRLPLLFKGWEKVFFYGEKQENTYEYNDISLHQPIYILKKGKNKISLSDENIKENQKHILVSHVYSGLGNRIKGLLSTMREATEKNYDYKVLWEVNNDSTTIPIDIIIKNIPQVNTVQDLSKLSNYSVRSLDKLYVSESDPIENNFSIEKPDSWNKDNKSTLHEFRSGRNIDFEYDRIPSIILDSYVNEVNKLTFSDEVNNKVNIFLEKNQPSIGIHIRSWVDITHKRGSMINIENYFKELDNIYSGGSIFVTSDDSKIIDIFKNSKYKENIITNEIEEEIRHLGKVDDFVDMLILSKCPVIIGTYISSFTEVAWYLGGCKAKVIIPKPNLEG